MLQLLLMLLGLAFPNSNYTIVTLDDGSQVIVENYDNGIDKDTGGEDAHIPPKK